jgi:ubiquinone biosynthesis protein UbiJ
VWLDAKPPRVTSLGMSACSCTVRAQVVDFQAMLEEPKVALSLFQQGKIQVTGDTAVATRFHLLLAPLAESVAEPAVLGGHEGARLRQ